MPFSALHELDGVVEALTDRGAIAERLESGGMLWVHFRETTEEDVGLLGSVFGLHPLALQDCLNPAPMRPKIDDFGDYLFLLLNGIDHEATSELVVIAELDLFIGRNFVVTSSLTKLAAIDDVFERAALDPHVMARGPGLLPHTLIDALVDAIAPTIDRMDEVADLIEEEVLTAPSSDVLPAILRLKRSAFSVHRAMQSQRELLARLARGDYQVVSADYAIYYRDIHDHIDRIDGTLEGLRERADFAATTYLSRVTIRQNETMRVLATAAAVFLPLTLVAGIYGMNFENMPELGWRYGYFAVLTGMAGFGAAVVWWLWGREWIAASGRRLAHELHFRIEPPRLREAMQEAARLRRLVLPTHGSEGRRRRP